MTSGTDRPCAAARLAGLLSRNGEATVLMAGNRTFPGITLTKLSVSGTGAAEAVLRPG